MYRSSSSGHCTQFGYPLASALSSGPCLYIRQKDTHHQFRNLTASLDIHIPRELPNVYNLCAQPAESQPEPMLLLMPCQHPFHVCSLGFESAVWYKSYRDRIAACYCIETGREDVTCLGGSIEHLINPFF
jgi:hypothetical protein